ncbi:MAG TPA: protein translocase subunit SecF [Streptosporangiaceae bacterium]|nr:protein translocase subunit SecF [Streptosporangiaceae bacterium]
MSRLGDIGGRLYRGEVSFDFIDRKRVFYLISASLIVISLVALLVRGLNYSVEFKGGTLFQFKAANTTVSDVGATAKAGGAPDDPIVQQLTGGGVPGWQVQTQPLTEKQVTSIQDALSSRFHAQVSINSVGASWGKDISQKALEGLIFFLVAIVLYLTIAFEWKMAAAAIIKLLHDILIAVGIYALIGFEVSPASVIGLLTILGYSLYDTVVVFDKVRENTAGLLGGARMTYSQSANLAVNQTLVRSINTAIIGLLPVAAILFVGAGLLGAGTLKDLALVLFVGMLLGTYSSICIATPLLASFKEREPQYQALARRVAAREASARAERRQAKKAKAGVAVAGVTAIGSGEVGHSAAAVEGDGIDQGPVPAAATGPPSGGSARGSAPRGQQGQGRQGQQRSGGSQRQQPRRSSAAKRRPSGKKKR